MVYYNYNKISNVVSLDSMLFIIKKSYKFYYNYINIDYNFDYLIE